MKKKSDDYKTILLMILMKHVGRTRVISMGTLTKAGYGDNNPTNRRYLRRLVADLRKEGTPVISRSDKNGGGYYVAGSGSDLEDYGNRLRVRGLKILKQEAILRGMTLLQLMGEVRLYLESTGVNNG